MMVLGGAAGGLAVCLWFIVPILSYMQESATQSVMFGKTLSTMDDGSAERVGNESESTSKRAEKGAMLQTYSELFSPTPLVFYHLKLGKIFFAFEPVPLFSLCVLLLFLSWLPVASFPMNYCSAGFAFLREFHFAKIVIF